MATPVSEDVVVNHVCKNCVIKMDSQKFQIDLIVLPVTEYDVILGMDWLSTYHVILECFNKKLTFTNQSGTIYTIRWDKNNHFRILLITCVVLLIISVY